MTWEFNVLPKPSPSSISRGPTFNGREEFGLHGLSGDRNVGPRKNKKKSPKWWTLNFNHYLVGGWVTPLKNMKVNWDDYLQYLGKTWNVPNHQPVMIKWSFYQLESSWGCFTHIGWYVNYFNGDIVELDGSKWRISKAIKCFIAGGYTTQNQNRKIVPK